MAPKILKGEKYNYKSDLWSIGVIIYRLKFVKPPFNGQTEIALIKNINRFNNNKIKKTGNEELDDLIKRLLEKDYEKRLSWDEYFNHPFFYPLLNKINLIYYKKEEKDNWNRDNNLFGEKFVENNKNNITLKINGIESALVQKYELKYGENNLEIIIKNKITNFEHMFYDCISLKNIEGLKYLDASDGNNFSGMFNGCESLQDIKGLENWNVSNGNDFSGMFNGCISLKDIKGLENWDVSKGNNFSTMFYGCISLKDIKKLENWNVLNGKDFSCMFNKSETLSDIKGLENWNASNGNNTLNETFESIIQNMNGYISLPLVIHFLRNECGESRFINLNILMCSIFRSDEIFFKLAKNLVKTDENYKLETNKYLFERNKGYIVSLGKNFGEIDKIAIGKEKIEKRRKEEYEEELKRCRIKKIKRERMNKLKSLRMKRNTINQIINFDSFIDN